MYAPVPAGLLFLLVGVSCSLSTGPLPVTSSSFPNPSLNTGLKALIITGLCKLPNCLSVVFFQANNLTAHKNKHQVHFNCGVSEAELRHHALVPSPQHFSVLRTATQACQQPHPCSTSLQVAHKLISRVIPILLIGIGRLNIL